MHADWLKIVFLLLNGDTELAHAVDIVMARAKRIYILMISVNKLFLFSLSGCFLQEIENMYSAFLSSFSINLPQFYHKYRSLIDYATHYLFRDRQ